MISNRQPGQGAGDVLSHHHCAEVNVEQTQHQHNIIITYMFYLHVDLNTNRYITNLHSKLSCVGRGYTMQLHLYCKCYFVVTSAI